MNKNHLVVYNNWLARVTRGGTEVVNLQFINLNSHKVGKQTVVTARFHTGQVHQVPVASLERPLAEDVRSWRLWLKNQRHQTAERHMRKLGRAQSYGMENRSRILNPNNYAGRS